MYGVYRGDNGEPFVLPSVIEVYEMIYFISVNLRDHETFEPVF